MAHADAHDSHDTHAHVDGDDLPNHGPVLEEPRSPMWLPFLGAALLGVALVWWLSTPNDSEERATAAAAASASASASEAAPAEAAPQAAPPPQPQAAPPPRPAPPVPSGFKVAPTVTINPAFRPK